MLLGFALLMGGFEVGRIFWDAWWEVVGAAAVASLAGLAVICRAEIRARPQRMLRKARHALSFPTQWAVKFNKSVPNGGVIPVAVIRSDGVRFVIDIQGHTQAEWNNPLDATSLLVGKRGKKFKTDPAAALMQAATAWGATPVLWLPEARSMRNLRKAGCNLIVVMGSARELNHVLRGAEIVPLRQEDPATPPITLTQPDKVMRLGTPEMA